MNNTNTEKVTFPLLYPNKIEYNELDLHGGFLHLGLLDLGDASGRLGAHAATTPVLPDLVEPVIVVGLDGFN